MTISGIGTSLGAASRRSPSYPSYKRRSYSDPRRGILPPPRLPSRGTPYPISKRRPPSSGPDYRSGRLPPPRLPREMLYLISKKRPPGSGPDYRSGRIPVPPKEFPVDKRPPTHTPGPPRRPSPYPIRRRSPGYGPPRFAPPTIPQEAREGQRLFAKDWTNLFDPGQGMTREQINQWLMNKLYGSGGGGNHIAYPAAGGM